MAVNIKCARYDGDPRVIDKNTTLIKTLTCRVYNEAEVVNPLIIVNNDSDVENCNYFTIGFRKYFKVKEYKINNKVLRIQLHEDVLSTWMPRVYVIGNITVASKLISENIPQKFFLDANKKISRISFQNDYGEITSEPIVIVQSPLSSIVKT